MTKKGGHHDSPFPYIIIYKTTFFKPNCLGICLAKTKLILFDVIAKLFAHKIAKKFDIYQKIVCRRH